MCGITSPNPLPCFLLIVGVVVCCIYDNHEWFNHTRITALSSLVIACLTIFLAYDTRKSRQALYEHAIKPVLNLQLTKGETGYSLCLQNTGVASALNISISVSNPQDMNQEAAEYFKEMNADIRDKCALLNQTILYLPPNKMITTSFGSSFDNEAFGHNEKYTITRGAFAK